MANRQRPITKKVYLDEDEVKMVEDKMLLARTTNFNSYARKMLIDGLIIKPDYSAIKELTAQLGRIGNNINQIAKRTNETRNFYDADMKDMLNDWNAIKSLITRELLKHIKSF